MQPIDWLLTALPILLILGVAIYTKRFVRSVADFLAGGRCAGRYLIANAYGESAAGVANTMSKFEIFMVSGFTVTFWNTLSTPILLLVLVSGFVLYRYRETRALTLAQFFEMRYSRNFRIFMGILAFGAGILNYGIFPAVGSRFFVYFLDLPTHVPIAGFEFPTYILVMAGYLSCVLLMLTVGGQITLMVTDCIEGLLSHAVLLLIVGAVFMTVHWDQIVTALSSQPANQSMIDPFDAWKVNDFNASYVLMTLLLSIYGTMALQNTQGFNAAARTPHESRMAGILGKWRLDVRIMLLMTLTIATYAFLHHPQLAALASGATKTIAGIPDDQIRKQMSISVGLRYLLPPGIRGLFCATMVMGLIAGDCSHIHSWSSIFIQDVVLPLRKKPLTTAQHLRILRLALIGVACFGFVFSILFSQTHYIALWWQITNAIFISGAGAAIIGGLYWKRGTTRAAWSAVALGAVLALTGIICKQVYPKTFPLNGLQVAFVAALASSVLYVVVSLLDVKSTINLKRMLHRDESVAPPGPRLSLANRIFGFNENFTRSDKAIAVVLVGWSLLLALITAGVSLWNLAAGRWPLARWADFWFGFGVIAPLGVGGITLVWFTIGGVRDVRDFFRALRNLKRDDTDDGRVIRTEPAGSHPPIEPPEHRHP